MKFYQPTHQLFSHDILDPYRDPGHPLHFKLDRHHLRSIPSLPVPILVLPLDTFPALPNTIPLASTVSLSPLSHLFSFFAPLIATLSFLLSLLSSLSAAIFCMIEYGWLTYPSTTISSSLLVAGNVLVLVGVWCGDAEGKEELPRSAVEQVARSRTINMGKDD